MTKFSANIFAAMWLVTLAASCGVCRKMPPPDSAVRDSVVTVIRDSTVWRDSIIWVEIPRESQSAVTPDDSSHLETTLAVSDAAVRGGRLSHTLRNKPGRVEARVSLPSRHITSEAASTSTRIVRETVEVERRLTWWQETKMKCGAAALIIAGAILLWLAIKTLILKRRGLI